MVARRFRRLALAGVAVTLGGLAACSDDGPLGSSGSGGEGCTDLIEGETVEGEVGTWYCVPSMFYESAQMRIVEVGPSSPGVPNGVRLSPGQTVDDVPGLLERSGVVAGPVRPVRVVREWRYRTTDGREGASVPEAGDFPIGFSMDLRFEPCDPPTEEPSDDDWVHVITQACSWTAGDAVDMARLGYRFTVPLPG